MQATNAYLWYKDAIIYELHIKAFADGNGDGTGDFKGLMSKLDYLQQLGVTAIWLLPFYPSPLRDDGYDIADYYTINPAYGTIAQFKELLTEAHKRNLKVITELVINHTSDQHPWFQRARRAFKGSAERDFYVWTDDPNQWKDVRIIFTDYEKSNWTWDPVAQQYYWHRFFHHQPDLNFDSPHVQQEIMNIINYWCSMGVDGFRLDAVPYLYERENTNGENLPETHAFLKRLRTHVDEHFPGTVFLAEANMWPEEAAAYFGDGDECHMNYHFPVMPRMFMALQMEDRYPITDIFEQTPAIPEGCQWAMFLRNHDELTLEMVTDEERDYMYKVYAKDPKAKINLGIRHRLAPLMGNNRRKIELMNCLLFSMPGTPVIYYGDEIGMGDNVYLGDRDGVRTPMQWNTDRNGGFSEANPQKLYLPVVLDPEYHYESVNVETQQSNTSSLLWFMKRMIALRKKHLVFGRGDIAFLKTDNTKILAFTRTYEEQHLLVIVNLSKHAQPVSVQLPGFGGYVLKEAFSSNAFPAIHEDKPYFFTMGSYGCEWYLLEKKTAESGPATELPEFHLKAWKDIVHALPQPDVQQYLNDYLQNAEWFSAKGRAIQATCITNIAPLLEEEGSPVILLLEVYFESGFAESYQLPLAFVQQTVAAKMLESNRASVVAKLTIGEETGLLVDALFTRPFQQLLLHKMLANHSTGLEESNIEFTANDTARILHNNDQDLTMNLITEDGFTALHYSNGLLLKIYRKIDPTTNPDYEITRYLSEERDFEHVPRYAGGVEWRFQRDTITLGMMQVLVENHGDGYSFMRTRIDNYIERLLAGQKEALLQHNIMGSLTEPVDYTALPEVIQIALGNTASEAARLIGIRIGEMHKALSAEQQNPSFIPEPFSLHYQRSLFASMLSLARETLDMAGRMDNNTLKDIPDEWRSGLQALTGKKTAILGILKKIYDHKLEVNKTRIHGNLHLGQILFTGKDIVLTDFGGDPERSFSDRRLKRSPLRDVAAMIASFRYVAYDGFLKSAHMAGQDSTEMLPFARIWVGYMSRFFIKAWLDTVAGESFVPSNKNDLKIMLDTYLMENMLLKLKHDIQFAPASIIIPLKSIDAMLQ